MDNTQQGESFNKFDWSYFADRRPFKKSMEQVCDFGYYTRMEGSPLSFRGHYTIHYYFSFDMEKLLNGFRSLKQLLRRTKAYRCVVEIRELVEEIPDDWKDFCSHDALAATIFDLIELCKPSGTSSQHYHYDGVKNDNRQDFAFQQHFYGKMVRPMISISENNGWEREIWRWWLDVPDEPEVVAKLMELQKRFERLGAIDQKIGKTTYRVSFVAKEYDDIRFDSEACTYLSANNRVSGKIDMKAIKRLVSLNNDALFEAVYKGGIAKIFEEANAK